MSEETLPAGNPRDLEGELEQSRQSAARLLEAFARKLGSVGGRMPFGRKAAGSFGRAARYVQDYAVRDMAAGIDRIVRKNPVPSIMLAVVAGFLVGRAIQVPLRGHSYGNSTEHANRRAPVRR